MDFYPLQPEPKDWDRLKAGVADALVSAPDYESLSFDIVKRSIESRIYQWVVCEEDGEILADFITTISNEGNRRVFLFPIMFGKQMERWVHEAEKVFSQQARFNGCHCMRMVTFKKPMARMCSKLFAERWTPVYLFEQEV